jgi:uncharacterized GH25 family protein
MITRDNRQAIDPKPAANAGIVRLAPAWRRRLLALLTLAAPPLAAHDFWLEPSNFAPQPGERVSIGMRIGEQLVGDSLPYIPAWFERFLVYHRGQASTVDSRIGDTDAGRIEIGDRDSYLVLYQKKANFVKLEAKKFETYLRQAGLEQIIEERARRGETSQAAGEFYMRCAKTLFGSDPGRREAAALTTDCPIDLMLEPAPTDQAAAGPRIRLLFRGAPLAKALVSAFRREDPEVKLEARTDADGRASLPSLQPGHWIVRATHMVRFEQGEAQWHSYWASLTLRQP